MFLRVDGGDYENVINLDNVVNIATRLVSEGNCSIQVFMVDGQEFTIFNSDEKRCMAVTEALWEFIFNATQGGPSISLSSLINKAIMKNIR